MKINILIPHLKIAGGTRIMLTYATLLSELGNEVTIYVVSKSFTRRLASNVLSIKPSWIKNFRAKVIRVREFSPQTISPADVLLATTYQTARILAYFPATYGKQFYLLQHDEGLYHGPRELVDEAYRLPQKKIVVATWLKELLRDTYQQDADLLLNPIDPEQFRPTSTRVFDGTIRILVLAHTYEWKGTREAVHMVNTLKKKYPNIRLVLYGARTKNVDEFECDEYHYNLPQDELKQLYSNVDIYLCTSWDEGFGLPSLEAMACGTAVVTYDNGGSRDFAHDGETAFVAPHRDENALFSKLELAVQDTKFRAKIATQGNTFVSGMPTWQEQGKRLESILKKENHV